MLLLWQRWLNISFSESKSEFLSSHIHLYRYNKNDNYFSITAMLALKSVSLSVWGILRGKKIFQLPLWPCCCQEMNRIAASTQKSNPNVVLLRTGKSKVGIVEKNTWQDMSQLEKKISYPYKNCNFVQNSRISVLLFLIFCVVRWNKIDIINVFSKLCVGG